MSQSFGFESSIDPDFLNFGHGSNVWVRTAAEARTGSYSIVADPGDNDYSSLLIIGDFDAGDVDYYFKGASESGADYLYFRVDDGDQIDSNAGAYASWTAGGGTTLTAGTHALQFFYLMDNSTDDGNFYLDDITVPDYTVLPYADAETFASGLPTTGWTNDPTSAEEWTGSASGGKIDGYVVSASGQDDASSDLEFNSDSGASAGSVAVIWDVSSEEGYDEGFVDIDGTDGTHHSGAAPSSGSFPFGTYVTVDDVTSGTHEYIFKYVKDSSSAENADVMRVHLFYEPDMSTSVSINLDAFRWRNDDGSETAATWKQTQNTNHTGQAKSENIRLRCLIEALAGDPGAETYQLEWKKSGDADSEYQKVT